MSDKCDLFMHFHINHKNSLKIIEIDNAYKVVFIEQSQIIHSGYKKYYLINKLKATINITR